MDGFAGLNVVVLGGLVMDAFVQTPQLPAWGKAVQTKSLVFRPGGKGLNQAKAASRLGANVAFVGAVGNDTFSEHILAELDRQGIDATGVEIVPDATSPITLVFSRGNGETSFMGWKNSEEIQVNAALVQRHKMLLQSADVLLCTLEVSPEAVAAALNLVSSNGGLTVLNPAPPLPKPYNITDLPLQQVDILIPNEWEARELAGSHGAAHYSMRDVAAFLGAPGAGAQSVCITRAHLGCTWWHKDGYREFPAYQVEARDTTGASDAFCATLALHLRAGNSFVEAIQQAHAAGAWVVTKLAAEGNMPTTEQLRAYRHQLDKSDSGLPGDFSAIT